MVFVWKGSRVKFFFSYLTFEKTTQTKKEKKKNHLFICIQTGVNWLETFFKGFKTCIQTGVNWWKPFFKIARLKKNIEILSTFCPALFPGGGYTVFLIWG